MLPERHATGRAGTGAELQVGALLRPYSSAAPATAGPRTRSGREHGRQPPGPRSTAVATAVLTQPRIVPSPPPSRPRHRRPARWPTHRRTLLVDARMARGTQRPRAGSGGPARKSPPCGEFPIRGCSGGKSTRSGMAPIRVKPLLRCVPDHIPRSVSAYPGEITGRAIPRFSFHRRDLSARRVPAFSRSGEDPVRTVSAPAVSVAVRNGVAFSRLVFTKSLCLCVLASARWRGLHRRNTPSPAARPVEKQQISAAGAGKPQTAVPRAPPGPARGEANSRIRHARQGNWPGNSSPNPTANLAGVGEDAQLCLVAATADRAHQRFPVRSPAFPWFSRPAARVLPPPS